MTDAAQDNELYERSCDLVEAAAEIRRIAGASQAARAVPAVLGPIEAAMRELLWASAAMEKTIARLLEEGATKRPDTRMRPQSERMLRGYTNLQLALADAERASAAARSLAARAVAADAAFETVRLRG